MLKQGDRVKYRDLVGEVRSVLDDMIIVKLPDGKEYSLPYDSVTLDGAAVVAPTEMTGIMNALKPYLKNVSFLNDLAKVMSSSGIGELHIKDGSVRAFNAKESLEERTARYRAEAIAAAEQRAKQDHDREGMVVVQ